MSARFTEAFRAGDPAGRSTWARSLAWSSQLDPSERVYAQLLKEQSDPALQLEYGQLLSWMGASHAAIDRLADVYNKTHSEQAVIADPPSECREVLDALEVVVGARTKPHPVAGS